MLPPYSLIKLVIFWNTSPRFLFSTNPTFSALLEEIIIEVPTTRHLTDLSIPMELGIGAVEGPEPIRTQRVTPHLLGLLAPILHRIQVLSKPPISLLRILHHSQY